MSGGRGGRGSRGRGATGCTSAAAAPTASGTGTIGDPDVALAIDMNAVRRRDQSRAKVRDQIPVGVEFQNRIKRRADAAVGATPLANPDTGAVPIDVDRA